MLSCSSRSLPMAHTVMLFAFLFVYTLPPGAASFSISWFCCHVLYYPSIENAHKNFCRPCTFLDVRADFYSAMKNTPRQIFSQQLCCETLGQATKQKSNPTNFSRHTKIFAIAPCNVPPTNDRGKQNIHL